MSEDPAEPAPEEEDDFPDLSGAVRTVLYMVGSRFSDGPIRRRAAPGPVLGELTTRVSKLLSALKHGGSSLATAVAMAPNSPSSIEYAHSVDILFAPIPADADDGVVRDAGAVVESQVEALERLVACGDDIDVVAADFGGAVTTAYRQLASFLAQREITAKFYVAIDREPKDGPFATLPPGTARSHAQILRERNVSRVSTVSLTGRLAFLGDSIGSADSDRFKLVRGRDLTAEQQRAWSLALGKRKSVDGELTDEAETDVRRHNAWKAQITAEIEVTTLTASASGTTSAIEAKMLRIIYIHDRIDALRPAAS